MRTSLLTVLFFFSTSAFAGAQTASITKLMGSVQIFTHPSKTPHSKKEGGDASTALFEGEYYLVREAKVGDQLEEGNIIRTKLDSRARLVYENGDQILVAPGTSYRIHWEPKTETNPTLKLMYGQVRGVVSKGGPRAKFTIRTKAATMGVRGTDFTVNETPNGETTLSVIRGAVEMQPATEGAKPVEVKTGYSATTTAPASPSDLAKLELKETSREEFAVIEKFSITPPEGTKTAAAMDPTVEKKVAALEKKAIETTVSDIQQHQPELYTKLAGSVSKVKSVDELNSQAVSNLSQTAPSRPLKKKKPSRKDLDNDEDSDPYRQYFKSGT